jgi:cyclophilin family peptidyl-prolyl cis-trans isomerase/HEAT repeat protein
VILQISLALLAVALGAVSAGAQPGGTVPASRLAILVAEQRRAPSMRDVTTLRTGVRSRDPLTARLAVRAIGRLERPSLIADLLPALASPLPEHRAEAATAIGQAAQGWRNAADGGGPLAASVESVLSTLIDSLALEDDATVRAALCASIGRLPYGEAPQVARAEAALVGHAARNQTVADRLGVAKSLDALIRTQGLRSLSADTIETLRRLAGVSPDSPPAAETDLLRESRIRRLAVEALIASRSLGQDGIVRAARDPDAQVRRLAVQAAGGEAGAAVITAALQDSTTMVRVEALRSLGMIADQTACALLTSAAIDPAPAIALAALDALQSCGGHSDAVALLERTARDYVEAGPPRRWHRSVHALRAFAVTAPDRTPGLLPGFVNSSTWQRRMYAARAAARVKDRATLEKLAADPHDNVAAAAIAGLAAVAGHDADSVYLAALSRAGSAAVRAAALALREAPGRSDAVAALTAALGRLANERHSSDAHAAITAALTSLGAAPAAQKAAPATATAETPLNADDLRRLAAPRARISVRDVGAFELALFTSEAPATVLQFVQLAESGRYDGLTFHRVEPNQLAQGGSPGESEEVGLADRLRDEVGMWPHVRGTLGIATRGRDTGNGQFFINLTDNPEFDHELTVFGQLLHGIEVVDRILEGDVIDGIEILP